MTNVALLGVGRMGHELATHLLRAGHNLTVWNRTPSATHAIVAAGARPAASPEEAMFGAEVVMTALFGPDAVQEVIMERPALPANSVWLDITTVGPADAARFMAWASDNGVRYVHGPVIGSLGPARAGKLGVLLGGAAEDVAVVQPLAALWADPTRLRVVANAPAAASGKLLANLALAVSLQGLVEALRLGNSMGLDVAAVLSLLQGTGLGFIAGMKQEMVLGEQFDDTQFSVDLLTKDARLMLGAADSPLPAVLAALKTLETAQEHGDGNKDISVVTLPELAVRAH